MQTVRNLQNIINSPPPYLHGQYVSDITTHSINVRRPHRRWGPVDNVFLCHVDSRTTSRYERWPIKAVAPQVLYYNVFLCHVDLRTTSRYERWPIKAFLYGHFHNQWCNFCTVRVKISNCILFCHFVTFMRKYT